MTDIPSLDSPSLNKIKELLPKIEADEILIASGARGKAMATTRIRVALSTLAKLCKEARKEIPPHKA